MKTTFFSKSGLLAVSAAFFLPLMANAATAGTQETQNLATLEPMRVESLAAVRYSPEQILARVQMVNRVDLQAAQIALSKAQDSDVLAYARQMIEHHNDNAEQVESLASREGFGELNADPLTFQEVLDRQSMQFGLFMLRLARPERFDMQYISFMINSHAMTLRQLESFSAATEDTEIHTFLVDTRRAVQQHLEEARDLQRDLRDMD